jgi:hypothetical protein
MNLRSQFQILLVPVLTMAIVLVMFIGFSEYERGKQLKNLEFNIEIVDDIRKLISFATIERELSMKFLARQNIQDDKLLVRDLNKQRIVVDTRLETISIKLKKFDNFNNEKIKFISNTKNEINSFHIKYDSLRETIDKRDLKNEDSIILFLVMIKDLINLIASSSLDINDPIISKKVAIYTMYLNYSELIAKRKLLFDSIQNIGAVLDEHIYKYKEVMSALNSITDIAKSLADDNIIEHYNRLFLNNDIKNIDLIYNETINNKILKSKNLLNEEQEKTYYKHLKELEDYISSGIYNELGMRIDSHKKREIVLTIVFTISLILIIFSTYTVYNYIRSALFFGTIHIKSKILRVVTDLSLSSSPENIHYEEKNEIKSLLHIVTVFADLLKESLSKIRIGFLDLINLSNHLSESSEYIVKHIQRQSRYLQDTNFQMEMILESIKNSEISFENITEIIEDSSSKISNLNIDVVYVASELIALKQIGKKLIEIKSNLQEALDNNNFEEIMKLYNLIETNILAGDIKISNLTKIASLIKRDAELNNANLSDILEVITALSYETKTMHSEISKSITDSNNFIELNKDTVSKSEFVSSDVKMLNKYIINLDKEFNKFRF